MPNDPTKKYDKKNRLDHGFVTDHTLEHDGWQACAGPPPEGSKYQCRARKRGTNPPQRCKQWASKGYEYCKFHSGRRGKATKGTRVASYYSKVSGPTLRAKLNQLSNMPPDERYALCAEVDLARTMTEEAVRIFEAAFFPADPNKKIDPSTRINAHNILKNSVNFVGDLVMKATKARAVNIGTVDVEQLAYIEEQFSRIVEEEIAATNPELADRIIHRVKEIKMPERKGGLGADPETAAAALREAAQAIEGSVVLDKDEADDAAQETEES